MDRSLPFKPSSDQFSNMYDDQPEERDRDHDHEYASSQSYEHKRKDNQRTPRDAPGDRMHNLGRPERGHGGRDDRYTGDDERQYEHSRSPRDQRRRYADRDQEGYESPPPRSPSRSRSPYYGGPPNCTVILEGLPLRMTQEDILHELQHSLRVADLREVRLIKDKRTGESRQFAFAQFNGNAEAKRFLDDYYPAVPLYGAYDPSMATKEATKVKISYSREKDDRSKPGESGDDWKCEVCYLANYSHRMLCFRCNAPRTRTTVHGVVVAQTNMSSFSGFSTTGDSDASPDNTASQFLLVRGLEPGVNEELLSKGVSKLYRLKSSSPPGDAQNKKKIASTSNDASLGAKDGSLRRVLLIRDRKSNDSWRYGFAEYSTVEDAQAAMAKYKASDRFTISSKPVAVSYIHAGVFVPVLHTLGPESVKFTFSPLSNTAVKLMYWDEAAYASEFVTSVLQAPSAIRTKGSEHAKLAAAASREGLVASRNEGEPKSKKRKIEKDTEVAGKKVVAPHLQFWNNRHAELRGLSSKGDESVSDDSVPSIPTKASEDSPSQSFADLERKCCLLCSRQFKTTTEVNKHERVSQLHRDNMRNDSLVAKALGKLNKTQDSSADPAAYRDRAKERRQAFSQPKQPVAQHSQATKDPSQTKSPPKEQEDRAPVPSKGAALLGKMGWSAGEGLGAKGDGRANAITPEVYSRGVGIGAQGGKLGDALVEADRQTKGTYVDFLNKTKDRAKERFESMN